MRCLITHNGTTKHENLVCLAMLCPRGDRTETFFNVNLLNSTGSSQRRNAAMLDSDDTDSVSSSSTVGTENMLVSGTEEVQLDKESLLDQCIDALYEKR